MNRIFPADHILVATLDKYKALTLEQLPDLPEENIIAEPYGRNTAPTVAYAARVLIERDPDALMVATPADHDISNYALFCETIRKALDYAEENEVLLTLGIVPTRPDTSFGYIQVTGGPDAYEDGTPVKAKTFWLYLALPDDGTDTSNEGEGGISYSGCYVVYDPDADALLNPPAETDPPATQAPAEEPEPETDPVPTET